MNDAITIAGEAHGLNVAANAREETHDWVELDFYCEAQVMRGDIACPRGVRILDLLNTTIARYNNAHLEFVVVKEHLPQQNHDKLKRNLYIRKSGILFVTSLQANLGRGLGTSSSVYPVLPKTPHKVKIQLKDYTIAGNIFRAKSQEIAHALNDSSVFLPMTEAAVFSGNQNLGVKPFLAINKQHILSVLQE